MSYVVEVAEALLIIRTPFQAKLAEIALRREGLRDYDLIFLTHHKSSKTLWSYSQLAKRAQKKKLIFIPDGPLTRVADVAFYLLGLSLVFLWGREYDAIIFGSLDAPAVTGLATRLGRRLITLDDGSANVNQFGSYFDETIEPNWVVRRITGAPKLNELKASVERHYTIFLDELNAMDTEKLAPITGWPPKRQINRSLEPIVVCIGTAESIWLSPEQIEEIREYLTTHPVDYYIPHPMERQSLVRGVPHFPRSELLAEEALSFFPGRAPFHLVGAFSTTMLTTKGIVAKRTVLIPTGCENLIPQSEKAGCETLYLSPPQSRGPKGS